MGEDGDKVPIVPKNLIVHKVISSSQMAEDLILRNAQKDLLLLAMVLTTLSFQAHEADKGKIYFQ